MSDDSTFGEKREDTGGGAHVSEFGVGLSTSEDFDVRFEDGLGEGFGGEVARGFEVMVWDEIGGESAGEFTGGVGPHAIGDDKNMAVLLPSRLAIGHVNRKAVLVISTAHPRIA